MDAKRKKSQQKLRIERLEKTVQRLKKQRERDRQKMIAMEKRLAVKSYRPTVPQIWC